MTYGIHPFWFWNGDMDEKQIKKQIFKMHEQGIKGFVLCARQGLTIPYLSQKWFDHVAIAIAEAEKYKMVVWIYDEQPYPSGISGGKVVLDHPEFEAKHLVDHICVYEADSEEELQMELEWGKPLYAKAFLVQDPNEAIDFEVNKGIDILENIGSLFREEVYHEVGLTAYNRKRFLACDAYNQLNVKLEKGIYKVIIFMEVPVRGHKYYDYFVDPLHPQAVDYFIETTHELYKQHLGKYFGTTIQGFFTDEIHPIGYEDRLIPWSPQMPQIYYKATGRDLLEELPALLFDSNAKTATIRQDFYACLVEAFIETYDKKILDWCHANKLKYIGEKPILRSHQLAYMDIPGIDAGHQKTGTKPDMFSKRYRANGKIAASAAYFYHKESALCESFHSIGWGMEIQDMKWTYDWLLLQGITLFVNHAYYGNAQGLTKHDAPPSGFFQMPWYQHQKHLSAYVDKITSAMDKGQRNIDLVLLDPITSTWKYTTKDERLQHLQKFESLQQDLFQAGYDFYIMDPSLLEQCTKIGEGLRFEKDEFKLLIDPDAWTLDEIIAKCINLNVPRLQVCHKGKPINGLYAIAWEKEECQYHFVVNTGKFCGEAELVNEAGMILNVMHLQAFESLLIQDGQIEQAYLYDDKRTLIFDKEQKCQFYPMQENVLGLDEWKLKIDQQSHWVRVKPIIDQLEEGGFSLPVMRHDQFGTPKQMLFPEIQAEYTKEFIVETTQKIKLRIEKKGIRGCWVLFINGKKIESETFMHEDNYTDSGYEKDISSYITQGKNQLKILVQAKHSWEGILTPIYLVGDFLVQLNQKIDKLIDKKTLTQGQFAMYQTMGLPHYAGDIVYTYTYISHEDLSWFCIDDPDVQQSLRLRVNGQEVGVKVFSPYVWDIKDIWEKGENVVEIIASTTRLGYYENQYYLSNREPKEAYKVYERNVQ